MSRRSKQLRKERKDQGRDTFQVQRFTEQSRLRRERAAATGDLRYLMPSMQQHFHLLFNAVPNYGEGFETVAMAMKQMAAIIDKLELVEERRTNGYVVYEEGHVLMLGIKLPQRTGKHDVFMQVGECYDGRCPNIRKLAEHAFTEGQLGKPVPEV